MMSLLKNRFPVGSPVWMAYRAVRLGFKPLAPGHVLHGNILLKNQNAIYFYVPKVACSTLKKVCADVLGLSVHGDVAEAIHEVEFPYVKKYKVRSEFRSFYKFAFVRNPWDRLVSCYRDKVCDQADHVYATHENRFVQYLKSIGVYQPGMTFEDFVNIVAAIPDNRAEGHFRSQASLLTDQHGLLPFEKIGRFETLAEDFDAIAKQIRLKSPLPHLRGTGGSDYRDHYSSKMRELVRKRYEQDVTLFSYNF
jgi:hypothetical protein